MINHVFYNKDKKEWEKEENNLDSYRINTLKLTLLILEGIENRSTLEKFEPVIYIDCDLKNIYSVYPEPNDFDLYVSKDWNFKDEEIFIDEIPQEYKYWIYNDINLFEK